MNVEDPVVRGNHLIGLATRVQEGMEQENFNSAAILAGGEAPAAS